MSNVKFNFKGALKSVRSARKAFRKVLLSNKSSAPGIELEGGILKVDTGFTKESNPFTEVTIQVYKIVNVPSETGSWDDKTPGLVNARLKESTGQKGKYIFSNETAPLKPGDIFKLKFTQIGEKVIPGCLEVGKLVRFSSVAPKNYRYVADSKYGKKGELSMDRQTGKARVFWTCGSNAQPLDEIENPGEVIADFRRFLPFRSFAFGPETPFRIENGKHLTKTTIKTLSFGDYVPTDDAGHFVVNSGVTDPEGAEYNKEGQGATFMTFGVTALTFSWYEHIEPREDYNDPPVKREIYQQTAVRLITNEEVIIRAFSIVDKDTWVLLGPFFAEHLEGLVVVKSPYDRDTVLSAKVEEFAQSIDFDDGGSDKARAAIDAGQAVKRGVVATINKFMINLPAMIRKIGTEVSHELASKATQNWASAKMLTDDTKVTGMLQNTVANPYSLNVIGLDCFTKATDATSLANHTIYMITPNGNWNGKSGEEVIAEYEANEERSRSDRTFSPDRCLFYAVHNRTSAVVQDALAGISADDLAVDMDIVADEAGPSTQKRPREKDAEDADAEPNRKKHKSKAKSKGFQE